MQRGFAQLFALLVIIVVLVVAGGYLYLTRKVAVPVSFKNQIAESPVVPSDQTYKNPELGFEFKYPKEMVLSLDSEEQYNKRNNGDARKNFSGYVGDQPPKFLGGVYLAKEKEPADKAVFLVWVFENPGNLNGKGWYSKYWYYPFLWGVFSYPDKGHAAPNEEATISGRLVNYALVGYQQNKPKYVLIPDKGKMYLLISYTGLDDKIGEQVLKSFKFLK